MNIVQKIAKQQIEDAENALNNAQAMTAKEKNYWKSVIKTNQKKIESFNI